MLICGVLGVSGTPRVTVQPVLPAVSRLAGVCTLWVSGRARAACPRDQLLTGNQ